MLKFFVVVFTPWYSLKTLLKNFACDIMKNYYDKMKSMV